MADADGLILQVLPVADSDAEELADLAAGLHVLNELLSVDGASVAPLPAEAAPEGAKGFGDVAGWLVAQFGTLDGLRALVAAVRGLGLADGPDRGGQHRRGSAEGDRGDLAAAGGDHRCLAGPPWARQLTRCPGPGWPWWWRLTPTPTPG